MKIIKKIVLTMVIALSALAMPKAKAAVEIFKNNLEGEYSLINNLQTPFRIALIKAFEGFEQNKQNIILEQNKLNKNLNFDELKRIYIDILKGEDLLKIINKYKEHKDLVVRLSNDKNAILAKTSIASAILGKCAHNILAAVLDAAQYHNDIKEYFSIIDNCKKFWGLLFEMELPLVYDGKKLNADNWAKELCKRCGDVKHLEKKTIDLTKENNLADIDNDNVEKLLTPVTPLDIIGLSTIQSLALGLPCFIEFALREVRRLAPVIEIVKDSKTNQDKFIREEYDQTSGHVIAAMMFLLLEIIVIVWAKKKSK